jgi:beta-lactamase class A
MTFMFKRTFLFILSVAVILFMSNAEYAPEITIGHHLSSLGFVSLPSFSFTEVEATATVAPESVAEVTKDDVVLPGLRSLQNAALEQQLKAALNANPTWHRLIRDKRMSVGIVDMSRKDDVKYANVNGQHMMYAASLPKIAVLAAAHDAIERGELKESAEVKKDMRLMIAKSNNAATTRMIDRLGFRKIARTMTAPALKLYDPAYGGGLWVGKRYAAGGKRSPDPMKGISHAATTEQICRYFYLLANDELISEEASKKMRTYLVNPELHHKFVNTLDRVAPDATVYRKSGSWSTFHADVAMVQGPRRDYIITALVDDAGGEQICRDLALVLDRLLTKKVAI